MTEVLQTKINELELTVRTIEEILPDLPTEKLQKWQGIFRTALLKTEKELTASSIHTCSLCFFEEWGYREELPVFWYKKDDAEFCFKHDLVEIAAEVKEVSTTEQTLDELMDLI